METRGKTNTEFRNEVTDILARHESSFDQVNNTLKNVLQELQALRLGNNQQTSKDTNDHINPFALEETSDHTSKSTRRDEGVGRHSNLKLTFPKFNGEEPLNWIYRAEQYFSFHNIEKTHQVDLASFHLEGIALQWHRWFSKIKGPMTWGDFTKALIGRFGPTDFDDPAELLTRLKQTSSVAHYQEEFERISQLVDNLPDCYLISCFTAGLKDEVRLDVKLKKPRTLSETIGVARLIEERNTLTKNTANLNRFSTQPSHKPGSILGPPPTSVNTKTIATIQTTPVYKKITSQTARERREKGLCYYCDEKYIPGHRCTTPQLYMIEDSVGDFEKYNEDDECTLAEQVEPIPEISYHAITGSTHPQTIRVVGHIKNKEVTVLIDGGSTHNFIDQNIVSKNGLKVVHEKGFHVMVANQEKVECTGRCLALTLVIQGHPIVADFYVLPVAACHVVLGVQWLETLGPIETNYKELTMKFFKEGKTYQFQGLRRSLFEILNGKELNHLSGSGLFLQITSCNISSPPNPLQPEINQILSKYEYVFSEPTTLPPNRSHDHKIIIQPNHGPVSVRPYRYPYYQKNEIDKMVEELLTSGLVRPSVGKK